ncbi:MAG: Na+ dependent nucleoside transporter [Bacteroidetes bacterium]|nr:MAG: Na+ dependent nucleoside transporter [Bacteroidota bacterium]TNE98209.1 MAG: Na+ dependent nucleoside transporter [Bacteroidota bacterium]
MRITNWLQGFVTRSIKGILSLSFIFLYLTTFSQNLAGTSYYTSNGTSITFPNKSEFVNTDTSLFLGRSGSWKIRNGKLFLHSAIDDSTTLADTMEITYHSDSRISVYNGAQYFTFQQKKKERSENYFTSILRAALGMLALLFLGFVFSADRKHINWPLVLKGVLLQVVLALLILKAPFVEDFFEFLSKGFVKVVDMAHNGATFVFGSFMDGTVNPYIKNFATWILPSVIFFSALTSLMYYWGVLQKVVIGMAWLMKRVMGLSGAESVSAAGNIFLGQTEAPLLVKPYLGRMTKSEILCLMAGGMATIAGGVLASYIGFLGGEDPQQKVYFAKHLLTASLMSAPAAIVFAKMLFPEKEEINPDLSVEKEKLGANALEAITNGTTDGLKLAVNVGAMLIVFISLVALANYLLGKFGYFTGLNDVIASFGHYSALSFEAILGYSLAPFAWIMGVPWDDCLIVGQLLGEKTILNEFVAYGNLATLKFYLSDKATLMATYVLCGFANFASIGIQVGGIGALAPERKSTLAKFGVKALIAGTLACMSTAVIAGMLY